MKTLIKSTKTKQNIFFKVKSVDEVNHIVEGVFSVEVEDRQGEVVVQKGWVLDNYKKNPVVLWAHQHDTFPIAKMLEIGVDSSNELSGKMQFAVEEYEFAATAFALVKGGYLSAFSAGFSNNKYQIDQENNVVYLIENELLEVSVVPVPANQLALAKSKGIDLKGMDEEIETNDGKVAEPKEMSDTEMIGAISKSNVETIRGAIKTLTEVLKVHAESDNQVGNKVEHTKKLVGTKKISVRLLNKAVRELLGVKKSL